LEHFSHRDISRIFRDWVNTVVPGGEIEIRVPDLLWAFEKIKEAADNEEDVDHKVDHYIAMIYGWQVGEGHDHKTGFTKHRLEQLAKSSGMVDVEVTTEFHENPKDVGIIPENQELILTGKRG